MEKDTLVFHPDFGEGKILDIYYANNFPIHVLFFNPLTTRTFKLDDSKLIIKKELIKMTFKEWFLTIDFETRKEFVAMGPFALKKIAELAWNKSREETLKEIEGKS
jgi:hypothetical protein